MGKMGKQSHEMMTEDTLKCQQMSIYFPDLLYFSKFYRHNLKNRAILFSRTFISASETISVHHCVVSLSKIH